MGGGGRDGRRAWRLWWLVLGALSHFEPTTAPSVPATDAVKVISVQNMDALLRLRLAPELPPNKTVLEEPELRLAPELPVNKTVLEEPKLRMAQELPINKTVLEEPINSLEDIPANSTRAKRQTLCAISPECTCTEKKEWVSVSCHFKKEKEIVLKPGDVPDNLISLHLENAPRVTITAKTFSKSTALYEIAFKNIQNLDIQPNSFPDIAAASLSVRVEGCSSVVFANNSFSYKNKNSSMTATIADCNEVQVGAKVFIRLLSLTIKNVPKLVLISNSLAMDSTNSPQKKILFHNVSLEEIPPVTFPSSAHTIEFIDCHIHKISRDAFSATELSQVLLTRTRLDLLEQGAFSEKTHMRNLRFEDVDMGTLQAGVLTSALDNLTILKSRVKEVQESAFKVKAASINLQSNIFEMVKHRAFEITSWNRVEIIGNKFGQLDQDAFHVPFEEVNAVKEYIFKFENNEINKVGVEGLAFIPVENQVQVHVSGNVFSEPCRCKLQTWTQRLTKSQDIADRLHNTSYCTVTDYLAHCFQLRAGAMYMLNYTEQVCGSGSQQIVCQEQRPGRQEDFILNLDLNNEMRFITMIFITVLSCVTFILLIVIVRWVQRKGLIGRILSQMFHTSSLVTTASISRVNIHEYAEYAEIQNLQNQTQIGEELEEHPPTESVMIDDKATQTLPEELTQDLLQSLREKLDDPENYREARQMIEHLYDIIKVEESCNNRMSTVVEDTLYAELQPRMRQRVRNREVSTTGTDSPSLDELAPVHYVVRPALLSEYAEPRDRELQSHVYCELPGGVPDLVAGSSFMANRPLPEAPNE